MKKQGILNREIASVLARLGHTDTIVIADCGLPVPDGVKCIDVSLSIGEPGLVQVLTKVMEDMEIEAATIAQEMESKNAPVFNKLQDCLSGIEVQQLPHEQFKKDAKQSKMIIRTGEATPYSNVMLHAGVIF
ncbi:D-ribose pyranase [Halobacillus andaensis]|uniref:D-ribose pyranase n=1 Tax=Halobacillus andaensis TaxID=1176239 RepID=UPI003D721262